MLVKKTGTMLDTLCFLVYVDSEPYSDFSNNTLWKILLKDVSLTFLLLLKLFGDSHMFIGLRASNTS